MGEVDLGLTEAQINWGTLMRSLNLPPVELLLTVFVHEPDVENVVHAINKLGISLTRLPSQGGFLRQNNITLLIGVSREQMPAVIRTLKANCSPQIEGLGSLPALPDWAPQIQTDDPAGATIFGFEIERYKELDNLTAPA